MTPRELGQKTLAMLALVAAVLALAPLRAAESPARPANPAPAPAVLQGTLPNGLRYTLPRTAATLGA